MSESLALDVKPAPKERHILTNAQRDAILLACGTGAHKGNLAKEFGIRPETISRIIRQAKTVQTPSNPLASDYRPNMKQRAVKAINRGLECKRDPYKAANIGVKVLEGIGEFSQHSQVDEHREIVVRWAGFDDGQVIDASVKDVDPT